MHLATLFCPAAAGWFAGRFAAPTPAQVRAWPAIAANRHTLISAPTGSGKTLAAFLAAIDGLIRQGLEGRLTDATQAVYVSPLKALSNDIQRNLEAPLAGIRAALHEQRLPDVEIRTWVRTGDTPAGERQRMQRRPPHILVTTPESLYILLGSASGRAMLKTTRTVIVDEIHAIAGNKRGAHLALSLERLAALTGDNLLRIGLSATQKPIEEVAHLLAGTAASEVTIIDTGHQRPRDLALSTLLLQTMLAGALLGVEKLTARKSLGVAIAMLGVFGALAADVRAAPPGAWRGEVIMAGAVLCMALYNVFSRPFIQRSSALGFLALGMGTGALALILVGGFSGSIGVLREFNTPEWIAGIYLGVAGGALAFILWVLALRRATPTRVANTMTVNPIAAASLAAVLVGEPITLSLVGGLVAVFAGIWISTSERGQNRWLVQTR